MERRSIDDPGCTDGDHDEKDGLVVLCHTSESRHGAAISYNALPFSYSIGDDLQIVLGEHLGLIAFARRDVMDQSIDFENGLKDVLSEDHAYP